MSGQEVIDRVVKQLVGETFNGISLSRKEIEQSLEKLSKTCIICDAPSDFLSAFIPKNPIEFGGLSGKQRIIFYELCDKHRNISEVADIVEKKLSTDFQTLN